VYSRRTDYPRGDPENPVTAGDLAAKFHMLADGPWGKEKTAFLEKAALSLESVNNVRNLFHNKGAI
jgi:2-methylcitrate dehydratase PrpD